MLFEQSRIFLLECHLAMALFLIADIFRHGCSDGNAHAESAITYLAGEAPSVFVHPFGGVGL